MLDGRREGMYDIECILKIAHKVHGQIYCSRVAALRYGDQLAAGWLENIKCGLKLGSVCNGGYSKKIWKVGKLRADCPNRILLIKEYRTVRTLLTPLA